MEHPQPQSGPAVPAPVQFPPGSYPPVSLAYHQPMAVPQPAGITAIAIIGIVLASLWILTGLGGVLSLLMMFSFVTPGMMPPGFDSVRAVFLWNGVSGMISGLIAAWLLAVSIGCLRMRPWGRSGIVRYAQVDLAWIAVKLVVALAWAIPAQQRWMNTMINTAPPTTAPASPAPAPTSTTSPAAMTSPDAAVADAMVTQTATMTSSVTLSGGGGATGTPVAAIYTTVPGPFNPSTLQSIMAVVTAVLSAIYPAVVLVYMTRPRIKGAFTPVSSGIPRPPHDHLS